MDILTWLIYGALVILALYTIFKLIKRFFSKIEERNLGKIFFMRGDYLLATCSLLVCISALGFFLLIWFCNPPTSTGGLSTALWECSKRDLANRGNLAVIYLGPLLVVTILLVAFIRRLFSIYNLTVAFEIAVYSLVFIATLPLILLMKSFQSLEETVNEQIAADDEIKRRARLAHEEINGKPSFISKPNHNKIYRQHRK